MGKIIERDRSVIPACDVNELADFEKLVKETCSVEGIGAYKIGFYLGLKYGLPKLVETARALTDLPLIYDHQKAATDIPSTGKGFAKVCKESGVDAIILFPQAGPKTEEAWIDFAQELSLPLIVGGEMTHPGYKQSEGGFLRDSAFDEMYSIAASKGICDFVVPGNRIERIKHYKEMLEGKGVECIFYSPGLVAQGGAV
ncbi:MAG: hypothetical protein GOV15_04460, partial [Candidatus Diapherotrites archaeon]|nr:hypothetical protein [Candidatus Diapherotrites archaeon]